MKGKKLNILIQDGMKIYNWKEYDFVGTVAEFAKLHCKCKAKTYTNSVKYVSRHRYNNMDGREQKAYDDKRKRARRAYCIYTDDNAESGYLVSKKEFEAVNLPEVEKHCEPIFLTYRDVYIPLNFIGDKRVENPVPSAMLLFRKEAERFATQSMLALGYFNTRDKEEKSDVCISHTTIYIKYPCGIRFQFDSCVSNDGVDNCRLTLIRNGENDIYNCFRDGRILTVHGIERVCRPNAECQRADWFFS